MTGMCLIGSAAKDVASHLFGEQSADFYRNMLLLSNIIYSAVIFCAQAHTFYLYASALGGVLEDGINPLSIDRNIISCTNNNFLCMPITTPATLIFAAISAIYTMGEIKTNLRILFPPKLKKRRRISRFEVIEQDPNTKREDPPEKGIAPFDIYFGFVLCHLSGEIVSYFYSNDHSISGVSKDIIANRIRSLSNAGLSEGMIYNIIMNSLNEQKTNSIFMRLLHTYGAMTILTSSCRLAKNLWKGSSLYWYGKENEDFLQKLYDNEEELPSPASPLEPSGRRTHLGEQHHSYSVHANFHDAPFHSPTWRKERAAAAPKAKTKTRGAAKSESPVPAATALEPKPLDQEDLERITLLEEINTLLHISTMSIREMKEIVGKVVPILPQGEYKENEFCNIFWQGKDGNKKRVYFEPPHNPPYYEGFKKTKALSACVRALVCELGEEKMNTYQKTLAERTVPWRLVWRVLNDRT
ncbi:hypothetical protein OAN22_01255 [Alphaproteobacteria bacterium]|nr:hypothetical protein [Alphaproteobacteria bacterium]